MARFQNDRIEFLHRFSSTLKITLFYCDDAVSSGLKSGRGSIPLIRAGITTFTHTAYDYCRFLVGASCLGFWTDDWSISFTPFFNGRSRRCLQSFYLSILDAIYRCRSVCGACSIVTFTCAPLMGDTHWVAFPLLLQRLCLSWMLFLMEREGLTPRKC